MSTPGTFNPFGDVLTVIEANTRSLETLGKWNALLGREVCALYDEIAAARAELREAISTLGGEPDAET